MHLTKSLSQFVLKRAYIAFKAWATSAIATVASDLNLESAARVSVDTQLNTALSGKAAAEHWHHQIQRGSSYAALVDEEIVPGLGYDLFKVLLSSGQYFGLSAVRGIALSYNAQTAFSVGNGTISFSTPQAALLLGNGAGLSTVSNSPTTPCGTDQGAPGQTAPLREFWGSSSTGTPRRMASLTARWRGGDNTDATRTTEVAVSTVENGADVESAVFGAGSIQAPAFASIATGTASVFSWRSFTGNTSWALGLGGAAGAEGFRITQLGLADRYVFDSAGNLNVVGGAYQVAGAKVLGAQAAAVADATDATSVITQLNTLLSRLRTHGLIAS